MKLNAGEWFLIVAAGLCLAFGSQDAFSWELKQNPGHVWDIPLDSRTYLSVGSYMNQDGQRRNVVGFTTQVSRNMVVRFNMSPFQDTLLQPRPAYTDMTRIGDAGNAYVTLGVRW